MKNNFAWCFDGVPEENSLYLDFKGIVVEIPAIDLVFVKAKKLLGEKVYARFGAEFPIRFDFLDTMNGGNLSLQVHPIIDYIQLQFSLFLTRLIDINAILEQQMLVFRSIHNLSLISF